MSTEMCLELCVLPSTMIANRLSPPFPDRQSIMWLSVQAGSGALGQAYRAELREVMEYVVRIDILSNVAPGERTDLWLLTWDASAGEFRGSGAGQVESTTEVCCLLPTGEKVIIVS